MSAPAAPSVPAQGTGGAAGSGPSTPAAPGAGPGPALPEGSPPASRRRRSGRALPLALVAPAVALLVLALAYPLARQLLMSLQEFGLAQQFGQPPEWVGLANYRALVTDPYLWTVVARSIAFCLACAVTTLVLGIGVALLMTRLSAVLRLAVQVSLLLAWAMPVLAALTIWQWMFDTRYGVVNWLLTSLGGDFTGHSWLIEPLSFFLVAGVIVVWMSVPFVAFTTYAALLQVPSETVEAATLDGAGPVARFRWVVLPAVRPVLSVVALLQVIWGLRVFPQIYVLQDAGGISSQTNLLGTYIYRLGIAEGDFGGSSAVAIFMLVLTVALTFGVVRSMVREEAP